MIPVSKLSVKHFRTHTSYEVEFSESASLIVGPNGSGKTTLIEAIYIALQGTSFKGSDSEILQHGADWYRIDLTFFGGKRTVKFDPSRPSGKKQFSIDDKTHYRLPHADRYPIVLFEPDDLRLLSGSPQRRRDFLDRMIRQIDIKYDQTVRQYERSLKQRNNLLKQIGTTADDLFVWDVSLSKYGSYIIEKRFDYIRDLDSKITKKYQQIADSDDTIALGYSYESPENIEQHLLNHLHRNHGRDLMVGYTSVGPHRDDMIISLNGTAAEKVASRGETRTILLALKMLEADLIYTTLGKKPLLLLDDVFSELDTTRQANLTHIQLEQLIITSTTIQHDIDKKSIITLR